MPTSSTLAALQFITQKTNLYGGIFTFLIGIFGEVLNIIVFSTLRTFRQTTCSFYLITNAIANIGVLTSTLLHITYDGFNGDIPYTSIACKVRFFIVQMSALMSLATMCFATIDEFISMTKYKQWNDLRIARRLILLTFIISLLYCIPLLIYVDTHRNTCVINNAIYRRYYVYIHVPTVNGLLPISIMFIFSLLAFYKTRSIASRQIHIVRLSRDRQLTAMTVSHAWSTIIIFAPFIIFYIYMSSDNSTDSVQIACNQLVFSFVSLLYYFGYSCSFYIYCCVSKRFRKQVVYVLFEMHLQRWHRRLHRNLVMPIGLEMANIRPQMVSVSHNDITIY